MTKLPKLDVSGPFHDKIRSATQQLQDHINYAVERRIRGMINMQGLTLEDNCDEIRRRGCLVFQTTHPYKSTFTWDTVPVFSWWTETEDHSIQVIFENHPARQTPEPK